MIAAEKRYHVYEGYQEEPQQKQKKKKNINLSLAEKAKVLFLLMVLGAMCISMIITSAYISQIKYSINETSKQIYTIENEIENIQVSIEQQSKSIAIEEKALKELGMVYPSGDQVVFLDNSTPDNSELASLLREEAFN